MWYNQKTYTFAPNLIMGILYINLRKRYASFFLDVNPRKILDGKDDIIASPYRLIQCGRVVRAHLSS